MEVTPYPTIVYTSNEDGDGNWKIQVDGYSITKNVCDFPTALAVLVSCYWVFNLKFCPKVKNTLTFLTRHKMNLPGVNVTQVVVSALNKLS